MRCQNNTCADSILLIFELFILAVSAILYGLAWWFYPTANTCNKRLLTSPNEEEK